ncbi:hypothetical protein ACVWWQ_000093 [Rhodanobacter sp. TND4EL1]
MLAVIRVTLKLRFPVGFKPDRPRIRMTGENPGDYSLCLLRRGNPRTASDG